MRIENAPTSAALSMRPSGAGTGTPCWIASSGGQVPDQAVSGGQDGEALYVARARHEAALIPGKLVPSHGVCYIAWSGGEHPHDEYEVLCGCDPMWVPVSGDAIPPLAMPAGESEDGEPLFVGRVNHEGALTIGKVQVRVIEIITLNTFLLILSHLCIFLCTQPSHGTCYIPYGGQELAFQDYEILVINA